MELTINRYVTAGPLHRRRSAKVSSWGQESSSISGQDAEAKSADLCPESVCQGGRFRHRMLREI